MRRRVVALCALVALTGCPEEPARCGDGAVDPGEDEESCCPDTGCARGSCDASGDDGTPACMLPWENDCRERAGECLEAGPLRCAEGPAPPSYDCAACGCGGADACVEGVCYDAATRAAARDRDELPDDLELAEYVALVRELRARDAQPLAAVAALHADEPHQDPRRTAFLIGWDPRSPDGAELQAAWLAALGQPGLPSTSEACAPPAALWPEGARAQIVAPALAARVTCAYPGMFIDCALPLAADCVLGAGYLAETVVFVDLDVVLDDADAALLVRAGRAPPSQRDAILVDALSVWGDAAAGIGDQPGLLVADRFAAAYPSGDPHVSWVLLGAHATRALRLETYRVVWSNPPSQQFLVDHDIQSRECAFSWDEVAPGELPASVTMICANAGATLTAEVETAGMTLVDVSSTGG